MVEALYSNGTYRLTNLNGDTLMISFNDKFLKEKITRNHLYQKQLIRKSLLISPTKVFRHITLMVTSDGHIHVWDPL